MTAFFKRAVPDSRAPSVCSAALFWTLRKYAVKRRDAPLSYVCDHAFQAFAAIQCPERNEILFVVAGQAVVGERAGGSNLANQSSELSDRTCSAGLFQQCLEANRELRLEAAVLLCELIEPALEALAKPEVVTRQGEDLGRHDRAAGPLRER